VGKENKSVKAFNSWKGKINEQLQPRALAAEQ
jgi:hypothetical protein